MIKNTYISTTKDLLMSQMVKSLSYIDRDLKDFGHMGVKIEVSLLDEKISARYENGCYIFDSEEIEREF